MADMMKELEELCENITKQIKRFNSELATNGGKIDSNGAAHIDHIANALYRIKKTMVLDEMGDYSGGEYSRRMYDRSYDDRPYDDRSYARGRGRNAKRDSMGRYAGDRDYSREGYSSHSDMMFTELHDLMDDAPNDEIRAKYDRFIKELKASM